MSLLARHHSNAIMESIVTNPDQKEHIFSCRWREIRVTHCYRNGKRSGGLNIVAYKRKIKFAFGMARDDRPLEMIWKGRLKKGWKSSQMHAMFAEAYSRLGFKVVGEVVHKGNKALYHVQSRFQNGKVRCTSVLTGTAYDFPLDAIEVLTISPSDWYNKRGMQTSLTRYLKRVEQAKDAFLRS